VSAGVGDADLERRFGGLRRLYGDAGYARLRAARVAVVGLGGVGSWAAEALARSGVAALHLIDLDHVAESNVNRQVHAATSTLGMGKALALAARIADIHPGCAVHAVEAFADADAWPGLLGGATVDALVDACDQVHAKAVLAAWALAHGVPIVASGAAGGKRAAERLEVGDLADATHDPLLAALRQRLRQRHGAARTGPMGVEVVFSREPVRMPEADGAACAVDGSLNCHGYGSTVTVTATAGLVAAGRVVERLVAGGTRVAGVRTMSTSTRSNASLASGSPSQSGDAGSTATPAERDRAAGASDRVDEAGPQGLDAGLDANQGEHQDLLTDGGNDPRSDVSRDEVSRSEGEQASIDAGARHADAKLGRR
jgi:tRNA A37 threonylcarbamoyladenosine dehydratase